MEPENTKKKKKKKQKETRQRRDKGHAAKTSDGAREGKNQEGKKKGPNNEARIKLLTKKSLRPLSPLPPASLSTRERAADPSEPHDWSRIRYQESVTKFGSAFAGLH